jgi:hypothetical protein
LIIIKKYVLFFFLCAIAGLSRAQKSQPEGLMVNLLPFPEMSVITDSAPVFSWIVNRSLDLQTAYHLQIASSPEKLTSDNPDVWNTKKVISNQSINVQYNGPALEPGRSYYWRVSNWGKTGKKSLWSDIQKFNIGKFDTTRSWPGQSKWIEVANISGEKMWSFEDREPVTFHNIQPHRVTSLKNGNTLYDFNKDAFAYLSFDISYKPENASTGNDSLAISIGERIIGDSIDQKPGGSIIYKQYQMWLKPGTHDYVLAIPRFKPEYPHSQVMPLQMPEVIPFRYCEIENQTGVTVNNISQQALHVLYDSMASSFESSDERLNAIYEMCKYSTIANTFNGDYANSERERMMYEADCYIQQLCHYAIDRKFATARYSAENLIYHATWPTEWIFTSVFMAWADYLHTGNKEFIQKYYKDLKAKTLMGLETPEGLVSTRTGLQTKSFLESIHFNGDKIKDIVDWPDGQQGIYPSGETDHYEFKAYNTVVNAYYYRSLLLMAKMAEAIDSTTDANYFTQKAQKLRKIFNDSFFNSKTKIYVDGIGSEHSSLHANMFPLAFGLVPEREKESVVNFIKSKWMACGVYGVNYLMQALYNSGEGQYAMDLMTNNSDRGWLNMIRVGATMTTEAWDQKYMPDYYSWNHAWSASPAYIIPTYMMGIQPGEPGFGKIIIKPQAGNLRWAKMKLPTIRGTVFTEIEQEPGDFFKLKIDIPANTTAQVYLPRFSQNLKVEMDGSKVSQADGNDDWMIYTCNSGKHDFKVTKY